MGARAGATSRRQALSRRLSFPGCLPSLPVKGVQPLTLLVSCRASSRAYPRYFRSDSSWISSPLFFPSFLSEQRSDLSALSSVAQAALRHASRRDSAAAPARRRGREPRKRRSSSPGPDSRRWATGAAALQEAVQRRRSSPALRSWSSLAGASATTALAARHRVPETRAPRRKASPLPLHVSSSAPGFAPPEHRASSPLPRPP
mmetsp:Transcript_17663/g.67175  ORF Transcript_17663/g.67175 Transcript_17663/m.67175 type:complete len:203 (+) Transcript_17663:113-721(+)|eukprot:scaffold575_cov242-Pinguiococcus_pyrenoidosus.AAC.7